MDTEVGVKGIGRGSAGMRWGPGSYRGWVWMEGASESRDRSWGPSPSSPHLSPSVGPAETLSSNWAILRMREASKSWSGLWQGGR